MEANRLRRSGVSSRHGESRDSNQQQMSDPVSVEHVQARAIASHLIAATIPTGAQISSEERTEYNLLAARSLHEVWPWECTLLCFPNLISAVPPAPPQ